MRIPMLAAAALIPFAMPAAAQAPVPRGEDVAAMAPAIDRAADALLGLDVGPILDAADPWRRHPRAGRRTLGDLARRDDPYFDHRLRASIYGTTAAMANMLDAFAAAEPALRRSIVEMERGIDAAVRDARRQLPPPRGGEYDRDYEYEDGPYGDEPYDD